MLNVLIIDDELWARQVVRSLGAWNKLGLNIIGEADGGREGIVLIETLHPSIVITDMRMPGLDGVELLKVLNERYPEVKIIVMSGFDDFVYLKQAIRSRAIEYLLKPINPVELNAALSRCVEELQASLQLPNSWDTHVFTDKKMLDTYLNYRQQVYEYLLELNRPAVLHTLVKIEDLLSEGYSEALDGRLPARIVHDFLHLLEEFTAGTDYGLDSAWIEERRERAALLSGFSLGEIHTILRDWLIDAIDVIEAYRKNKNRLAPEDVQAYIDRHFQETISLETVSHHFFVSKEHLSRTFKVSIGENLSDYIVRKRMEKAKELIMDQRLAIKRVAELTGYIDIAYFYRVFKKHFGLTPGEMRKD
ncbi:two-component system response regulator YesN [Paenibacillus sp. V4I3]|uniref:response regulator n=1 Tax=Paenibacillus sp. V4I3 TaxID=3042305 RepID=UPI00278AC0C8|nr:response regulator [Paenibacillus sp. V4I3]MDQ0878654.1 two-component system response regulator YesN [Paenibacillus sp. V4I3]